MFKKVIVSQNVADALAKVDASRSAEYVLKQHSNCRFRWEGDLFALNGLPFGFLIRALYIGYEVTPKDLRFARKPEKSFVGEWSDNLSAWWSGANGMEYIAFKGSNQVFVFYPETYPGPPDMILQHTGRIETHADFDEAMRNGKKYSAKYAEVENN